VTGRSGFRETMKISVSQNCAYLLGIFIFFLFDEQFVFNLWFRTSHLTFKIKILLETFSVA
jgi:hypothetical protein